MGNDYVGRVDPTDQTWKSSPWTDLLKHRYLFSSLFCKNKVVLDSCCGTGWGTMKYIVPFARFTVGFDICKTAAETYKQFDNYWFGVMDARDFGLKDNIFDLVLSLDSLEHLTADDGVKYLSEMSRVCKKDGHVIGTTPLVIDDCLILQYLEWNKYHLCMYTRRSLEKTLRNIFSSVAIYEIYNKVSPYFLFICGKSAVGLNEKMETNMEQFILEKKREFMEAKICNYLSWAKTLISERKYFKAGNLFCAVFVMKLGLFWYER